MKYAVMSDIHANPQALSVALADARKLKCERFVMLGDTTGYGYDAKEALRLVRESFDVVLMGNHDSACIGRESAWTLAMCRNYDIDVEQRGKLSDDDKAWLSGLPYVASRDGAAFAHGYFVKPSNWGYVLEPRDADVNLDAREERVLFCGHTHEALAWERRAGGEAAQKILFERPATEPEKKGFKMKKGCRYLVNVGSVGYPRHDLCSTYVIWDTETERITFRRLPFDFPAYVRAMLENDVVLPGWLLGLIGCYVRI